jgi:hypothetical protein
LKGAVVDQTTKPSFETIDNQQKDIELMAFEFRDARGQTLDEANDANRNKKRSGPRHNVGPIDQRVFEELDTEVERQAFMMEAQVAAESIARQFGRKRSFLKHVAAILYQMGE